MTEIPMHGERGHHTPDDHYTRRFKIVYTRAVLPKDVDFQGFEILLNAIRTEPVTEAWVDEFGHVAKVLAPPQVTFYGPVPVPIF